MGVLAAWTSQHKALHLLLEPAPLQLPAGAPAAGPAPALSYCLSEWCMKAAFKAVHMSLQGLLRGAAGLSGPGRHRRLAWERAQGQVVQPLPAGGLGP